ncbi:NACHT domain-containing protein [Candidatus Leptofilum sp.]|uniref:NACHT domain-containing protein n=1 Tax=Candidatus Leptofilum sp. TaxID=3241576 RepID=UPI003B59B448
MDKASQTYLNQLQSNLNTYFNKSEFQSLCFDLDVDYDNFPEAKKDAIRELLRYSIRHQMLDKLAKQAQSLRPYVEWPAFDAKIAANITSLPPEATRLSHEEWKDRKKLLILLEKVNNFWVKGVFEKSVADERLLSLGKQFTPEMVENPWHDVVGATVYDQQSLDSFNSLLDVFKESDKALLILGEPGAGKTTTLLELAQELIYVANQDPSEPIPVILNLASWREKDTLFDWVVEELSNKYQIPRDLSTAWLKQNKLLLLLDGLDEVSDQARTACIHTINQFRSEHGLTNLVVSSRTHEYQSCGVQLKLGGAILLQALNEAQIDEYLATFGNNLASLREAIHIDAALQEMARSPLMLQIMTLAYEEEANSHNGDENNNNPIYDLAKSSNDEDSKAAYHQQIFERYVQRMLNRQPNSPYTPEQTQHWLGWLAQRMTHNNQTIFLIEHLQPSWHNNRKWQWLYLVSARLIAGIMIGLLTWIVFLIGKSVEPAFTVRLFEQLGKIPFISLSLSYFLSPFILIPMLSFLVTLIDGWYFEQSKSQLGSNRLPSRITTIGIAVAFFSFFTVLLFDPWETALIACAFETFAFSLSVRFIDGTGFHDEIRTVETLGWSWKHALKGLLWGVASGLISGWLLIQIVDPAIFWVYVLLFTLVIVLLNGFQNNALDKKSYPNQGILLSAKNSTLMASVFSIPIGLLVALTVNVQTGLLIGILLFIMAWLLYGGANIIKHYFLRPALWYRRHMPLSYIKFLDHTARNILLYKVGGGYVFVHRLLQEYFANLHEADA